MVGVRMVKVSPLVIFVFSSLLLKSIYVKYSIVETISLGGFIAEFSSLLLLVIFVSMITARFSIYLLISINLIYSALCLTTLIYFDYYNTIFTYKSLSEINQVGEISDSVFALLKKEYIFLFSDFILLAFWPKIQKQLSIHWIYINKKAAGCILASLLVFLSISIFRTYGTINELGKYGSLGMVGYQFLEAASDINSTFTSEKHISAETIKKNKPTTTKRNIKLHGIAKNKNIIIVQLEAVQNFLLNLKINGIEVTPNLNKLIGNSYYFPHFYTQVGKGNTSDAEFISNTSIYALGDSPMSTAIEGKNVPGLPRSLEENGYHTATFHANNVSFWNRRGILSREC
jgi:phosphoglycerol transferase MdoB-like AlkP superfamily enzyme